MRAGDAELAPESGAQGIRKARGIRRRPLSLRARSVRRLAARAAVARRLVLVANPTNASTSSSSANSRRRRLRRRAWHLGPNELRAHAHAHLVHGVRAHGQDGLHGGARGGVRVLAARHARPRVARADLLDVRRGERGRGARAAFADSRPPPRVSSPNPKDEPDLTLAPDRPRGCVSSERRSGNASAGAARRRRLALTPALYAVAVRLLRASPVYARSASRSTGSNTTSPTTMRLPGLSFSADSSSRRGSEEANRKPSPPPRTSSAASARRACCAPGTPRAPRGRPARARRALARRRRRAARARGGFPRPSACTRGRLSARGHDARAPRAFGRCAARTRACRPCAPSPPPWAPPTRRSSRRGRGSTTER